MPQLLRRAWHLLRRRKFEADLAEELSFHRSMKQVELEGRGLEPKEAAFATPRALGSVALAEDRARDVWQPRWLQGLGQDLRLAVRTLWATRLVSAVAVLSLALGIGANTAIFSLVNSLMLRTLPVSEPQRLATLSSPAAIAQGRTPGWTYATWTEVSRHARAFEEVAAYSLEQRFNVAPGGGEAELVDGIYVSGDFFDTLGVQPLIGRVLTSADDDRNGGSDGPVAVISHGLWQRHFGGAASVIGARLIVDHTPFTIVGVAPAAFFGVEVGRSFDVMVPIGADAQIRGRNTLLDQQGAWLRVMLRMKTTQSLDGATAALRGVQPQIREAALPRTASQQFQDQFLREPFALVRADAGTSRLRQQYERPLLVILAVVALVLLVACANIANLLLARATARRHELSVRIALGASSWRLVRQLLVESLVLASAGAAVGLAVAMWGSRALVAQLSTNLYGRVYLDLSLDWRVLAFTGAVAAATALLFGTAPALRAARVLPNDALKTQGRGLAGHASLRLSSSLVVAQVALSLVLVVAAGLFVRTFERLATLPSGFDRQRVLIANVNTLGTPVEPAARMALVDRIIDAVSAVPGVSSASASMVTPVGGGSMIQPISVAGAPEMSDADRTVMINFITPAWFATYGMPILAGRDLDDRDVSDAPPVVLVNEAFVKRFFTGRNPIGETVANATAPPGQTPVRRTIVGVVGDAIYRSLREGISPTMYAPLAQLNVPPFVNISLRSSTSSPLALTRSVSAALTGVDGDLTFTYYPLIDQVNASLAQERFVALLSGFFGALALLLAGLGLYGVTSYAVSRRRIELGIRMALGAEPARVVRLVLSQVVILVGAGVVIGGVVSLWASRYIASLLYGLQPRDPATLAGAAVVLTTVGALVAWWPAWRASRIDPAAALRSE